MTTISDAPPLALLASMQASAVAQGDFDEEIAARIDYRTRELCRDLVAEICESQLAQGVKFTSQDVVSLQLAVLKAIGDRVEPVQDEVLQAGKRLAMTSDAMGKPLSVSGARVRQRLARQMGEGASLLAQ